MTPDVPRVLPRYRRGDPLGWVVGDFPVHELLTHAPGAALEVRWHGDLGPDRLRRLQAACERVGVPSRRDDRSVEAKRAKGDAHVLAVFAKPDRSLATDRAHLVLAGVRDPGNVGASLRTALAFGIEDVATIAPAADPWSPHVLRASIGAGFALRIGVFADLTEYLATVPGRVPWLLDGSASRTLADAAAEASVGPGTLVAGPEWPGLSTDALALGRPVRIAHDPRVESLNVTVAIGIALHALADSLRGGPT